MQLEISYNGNEFDGGYSACCQYQKSIVTERLASHRCVCSMAKLGVDDGKLAVGMLQAGANKRKVARLMQCHLTTIRSLWRKFSKQAECRIHPGRDYHNKLQHYKTDNFHRSPLLTHYRILILIHCLLANIDTKLHKRMPIIF